MEIEKGQIIKHGLSSEQIEIQLRNFEDGFPFIKLCRAANINDGIISLSDSEMQSYITIYNEKISKGIKLLKFVPASGAASRMFADLFNTLGNQDYTFSKEYKMFAENLEKFAFFDDLLEICSSNNKKLSELKDEILIENILFEKGLNYSNKAKGLIKFHRYKNVNRTAFEEHLVEGAMYSKNSDNTVNIHFTVSADQIELFVNHYNEVKPKYEKLFGVDYNVSFSFQHSSTDCIAIDENGKLVKSADGKLLFRPGGHGALIENLNEQVADIIFVKNIDNVSTDNFNKIKTDYKKCLAGVLVSIQEQIFSFQALFKSRYPGSIESAIYAEALSFLEKILNIKPPVNQYYSEKEELYHYIMSKIFRPLRVCGMVKNQNEPGGGPFFVLNNDGTESLQIIESSQINYDDIIQNKIAINAKFFNPVDIVCGVKDFEGNKYDLKKFVDTKSGFITSKSFEGNTIKVQELPGLWNGAMSDWNTFFVEVPVETFSPVKTLNDLLRKEHQSA